MEDGADNLCCRPDLPASDCLLLEVPEEGGVAAVCGADTVKRRQRWEHRVTYGGALAE
jgi:hypothetical protein